MSSRNEQLGLAGTKPYSVSAVDFTTSSLLLSRLSQVMHGAPDLASPQDCAHHAVAASTTQTCGRQFNSHVLCSLEHAAGAPLPSPCTDTSQEVDEHLLTDAGQAHACRRPESHQLNTEHAYRGWPRMRPQSSSCTGRAHVPCAGSGHWRGKAQTGQPTGAARHPRPSRAGAQMRQDRTQQTQLDKKRQGLTGMLDRQRLPTPTEHTHILPLGPACATG